MSLTITACKNCGTEARSGEYFCSNCGKAVDTRKSRPSDVGLTREEPKVNPLSMILPKKGQPSVVLPLVLTGFGIFCLLPISMHAIEWTYESTAHSYLNEKALEAMKTGQNTEAIEIMTREQIERGKLTPDQQKIMDQALYNRVGQAINSHSYDLAVVDIQRISNGFSRDLREKSLAEVKRLAAASAPGSQPGQKKNPVDAKPQKEISDVAHEALAKSGLPSRAIKAIERVPSAGSSSAENSSPQAGSQLGDQVSRSGVRASQSDEQVSQSGDQVSRSRMEDPSQSRQSASSNTLPARVAARTGVSSAQTFQSGGPTSQADARSGQSNSSPTGAVPATSYFGSEKVAFSKSQAAPPTETVPTERRSKGRSTDNQDFVPTDLIRYNQELATFFSRGDKSQKEPPGFKEWVKLGKPKL